MAEKIATRAAYGEALAELAQNYPELVVLDADLSGATMTKKFAKACPERFFNMRHRRGQHDGRCRGPGHLRQEAFLLTPLPCSPPGVPMSRCATPSPIPV